MLRTVGRYVPPTQAGVQPATRWGTEAGVRELLGDGISSLQTSRQKFVWRFSSAEQYLDMFRRYYGPVLKAFAALDELGQAALASELLACVERCSRSRATARCWCPPSTWRWWPTRREAARARAASSDSQLLAPVRRDGRERP